MRGDEVERVINDFAVVAVAALWQQQQHRQLLQQSDDAVDGGDLGVVDERDVVVDDGFLAIDGDEEAVVVVVQFVAADDADGPQQTIGELPVVVAVVVIDGLQQRIKWLRLWQQCDG